MNRDLSKFEPPKAEPDGLTKKLFGKPVEGREMRERMTRADKFEEIFGYRPATDQILCNERDWCGENDACNYCMCNPNNIGREEDWWNAEYKS